MTLFHTLWGLSDVILTCGTHSLQALTFQVLNQTMVQVVTATCLMQICQARIANVEVPNNKCIRYSLQYIYGVGDPTAQKILAATGIDPAKRTYQLAEEELASIRDELENYTTEGDLRRIVNMNIKRYAGAYAGARPSSEPGCPVSRNLGNSSSLIGSHLFSVCMLSPHPQHAVICTL
jgi:small subunit ribosomal protein S13